MTRTSSVQKMVMLCGTEFSYTVRTSRRARRVRLTVHHDKSIVITRPYGISESLVERFVREKAKWILKQLKRFSKYTVVRSSTAHYTAHREEAKQFIEARVRHFAALYGSNYEKLTVRNQRTRWGSCSEGRTLSFNYRIMFLPSYMADYIIVHELCHLEQFDHSDRFWAFVAYAVPNYREVRKNLRRTLIS